MKSGVALITGGARRLGRQIALSLAGQGFDIVLSYNTSSVQADETSAAIERIGSECLTIKADVSKAEEIQNLVDKSIAKFGQLDILVNNAGVFTRGLWNEISFTTWDETLAINLTGLFLFTQAVAIEMVKRGRGRIINLASIGGIQAWPNHIPYSLSKSGVIALTRSFARALAPTVMVNAIAPGTIIVQGEEDPAVRHIPADAIPLKRYGLPVDITSLVVFLATNASYITGQIFPVDGGRSLDFIST